MTREREEVEIRALERRASCDRLIGGAIVILVIITSALGLLKHVYQQPHTGFSGLDIGEGVRYIIKPWLQEYRILSFLWGLVPAIDLQHFSTWLLFMGVMAIGGLLLDRGRRMSRVLQEALWVSPYLRQRGGIETTINIGAHRALAESGWQRFVRVSEGILVEVLAGLILLLIGLHSCLRG
jgi:hypothetical protein